MRCACATWGAVGLLLVAGCAGARPGERVAGVRSVAVLAHARRVTPPCLLSSGRAAGAGCVHGVGASAQIEAIFDEQAGVAPAAVGALLRAHGPEPEQCTVTLVAPTLVVTASHCLRRLDRVHGGACEDTWIVLPALNGLARETIACAAVVSASTLVETDALEADIALLRLASPASRAPLALDPTPLGQGEIVTVASVTPHPIYASSHRRVTRLCRVLEQEVAVAALGPEAAYVGWLEGCDIAAGNSGSPVLDARSAVRAIVHGGARGSIGVTTPIPPEFRGHLP